MNKPKREKHALISVYGDDDKKTIAKALAVYLPEREIRILEPQDEQTLEVASHNSVLIFIGIHKADDQNLELGRKLLNNPAVAGDVIAFNHGVKDMEAIDMLSKGFDGYASKSDIEKISFKQYLACRISKGSRRLESMIQEDEYKRLNDALSIAPVSMIIFDSDKRAVFVSDHYFRAYPKIAPRMIRGLRVYDAFEMMAREEGLNENDDRYPAIRQFWHSLSGSIDFTLDNGTSYRLKAISLPNKRGTLVMGQNISSYVAEKHKPLTK